MLSGALTPFVAGALALKSKPTGNATTISFYAKATKKANALGAFTQVTHRYYFYSYTSPSDWKLSWGTPTPSTGERRVNETTVQRIVHGKTLWVLNTFATPCATTASCTSTLTPLRLYVTKSATYWTVLSGPKESPQCWTKAAGATSWMRKDFIVGGQVWYVDAAPGTIDLHYAPLVHRGNFVDVTSTYKYVSDLDGVSEVDTINTKTMLFTQSVYHIGGTATFKAVTYYDTYSEPTTLPVAPRLNLCG